MGQLREYPPLNIAHPLAVTGLTTFTNNLTAAKLLQQKLALKSGTSPMCDKCLQEGDKLFQTVEDYGSVLAMAKENCEEGEIINATTGAILLPFKSEASLTKLNSAGTLVAHVLRKVDSAQVRVPESAVVKLGFRRVTTYEFLDPQVGFSCSRDIISYVRTIGNDCVYSFNGNSSSISALENAEEQWNDLGPNVRNNWRGENTYNACSGIAPSSSSYLTTYTSTYSKSCDISGVGGPDIMSRVVWCEYFMSIGRSYSQIRGNVHTATAAKAKVLISNIINSANAACGAALT
ncbi:MAG: hypothetical protein IT292_10120 [Deltaproteobacteria bacterium]|nr:hypothetical protein [Deltaproteobacteria bacterium]